MPGMREILERLKFFGQVNQRNTKLKPFEIGYPNVTGEGKEIQHHAEEPLSGHTLEVFIQHTGETGGSGHVSATLKNPDGTVNSHLSFGPSNYAHAAITALSLGQIPVIGNNQSDPTKDKASADQIHVIGLTAEQAIKAEEQIRQMQSKIKSEEIVYSLGASFGRFGKKVPNMILSAVSLLAVGLEFKRLERSLGHEFLIHEHHLSTPPQLSADNCVTVVASVLEHSVGISGKSAILPQDLGEIIEQNKGAQISTTYMKGVLSGWRDEMADVSDTTMKGQSI